MRKTAIYLTLTAFAVAFSGCGVSSQPQTVETINGDLKKDDTNASKIQKSEIDRKIVLAKETTPFQPMPLKTPDKIVRILTLPYVDSSGGLHSQSFKFVKIDEGEWIMGNYLTQKDGEGVSATLTPLR